MLYTGSASSPHGNESSATAPPPAALRSAQRAAVTPGDIGGKRQAQSHMAVLRAAFFAVYSGCMPLASASGVKPGHVIPYGEHRTARAVRGAPHAAFQRYPPALRRVARGILHKIHQRTQQLRPAHGQHGRSIATRRNTQPRARQRAWPWACISARNSAGRPRSVSCGAACSCAPSDAAGSGFFNRTALSAPAASALSEQCIPPRSAYCAKWHPHSRAGVA